MKFDYNKTLKYAKDYLGEKENECTYEYLCQLSKTTRYAFWNLRCELKNFAQPLIDVCNKIYSWFPESKASKTRLEFEMKSKNRLLHHIENETNPELRNILIKQELERKEKERKQAIENELKNRKK